MAFFGLFSKRTESDSRPQLKPSAARGSQKTYDLEAQKLDLHPLYGIRQPQNLDEYREFYLTHWLARRIISALVRLTLSDITTRSEDEELDRRVLEFNRAITLRGVLSSMLRQVYGYGAGYSEIVFDAWPGPSDVLGVHVVDSRSMRVDLDPWGKERAYIQLPQILGLRYGKVEPIRIDPATMLHIVRDPFGDSIYGHSVLQAIRDELVQSKTLERAMVKTAVRSATGQDLFSYEAYEGESTDEANEALDALVGSYNNAEPGDPLFATGMGTWRRQGPSNNSPPQFTKELEQVIMAAIAGADLTPAAVGFPFGQSMHDSAEMRIVLLSMIESIQSQIVDQLNQKLYRPLADLWNSDEIYVQMAAPVLLSEKERAEKETIDINNVGIKSKMGVIDGATVAQELGYDGLSDEERFTEWLEGGQTLEEQRNPNDPNTVQQDSATTRQNDRGEEPTNE